MNAHLPLAAAALLLFAQVHAQTTAAKPSQPGLPPPGMNDPGVAAKPEPAPAATAAQDKPTPAEMTPTRLPGKPIPMPRQPGDTGPRQAIPQVQVRKDGDRTIQEYRQSGRLYMIVVTPKNGPQQTYMVDPQGRLRGANGEPPVRPVMYKIMEWGKAPPPAESQGKPSGDDGSH